MMPMPQMYWDSGPDSEQAGSGAPEVLPGGAGGPGTGGPAWPLGPFSDPSPWAGYQPGVTQRPWHADVRHGLMRLVDLQPPAEDLRPPDFDGSEDDILNIQFQMWQHVKSCQPMQDPANHSGQYLKRRKYWETKRVHPNEETTWPWLTLEVKGDMNEWAYVMRDDLKLDATGPANFLILCKRPTQGLDDKDYYLGYNDAMRILYHMTKDRGDPDDPEMAHADDRDDAGFTRRGGSSAWLASTVQAAIANLNNLDMWHHAGIGQGHPMAWTSKNPQTLRSYGPPDPVEAAALKARMREERTSWGGHQGMYKGKGKGGRTGPRG